MAHTGNVEQALKKHILFLRQQPSVDVINRHSDWFNKNVVCSFLLETEELTVGYDLQGDPAERYRNAVDNVVQGYITKNHPNLLWVVYTDQYRESAKALLDRLRQKTFLSGSQFVPVEIISVNELKEKIQQDVKRQKDVKRQTQASTILFKISQPISTAEAKEPIPVAASVTRQDSALEPSPQPQEPQKRTKVTIGFGKDAVTLYRASTQSTPACSTVFRSLEPVENHVGIASNTTAPEGDVVSSRRAVSDVQPVQAPLSIAAQLALLKQACERVFPKVDQILKEANDGSPSSDLFDLEL